MIVSCAISQTVLEIPLSNFVLHILMTISNSLHLISLLFAKKEQQDDNDPYLENSSPIPPPSTPTENSVRPYNQNVITSAPIVAYNNQPIPQDIQVSYIPATVCDNSQQYIKSHESQINSQLNV
jgi:hypothetical protein